MTVKNNENRLNQHPIKFFIEENLVKTDKFSEDYLRFQKAYEDYLRWSKRNGYNKAENKQVFAELMNRLGFKLMLKQFGNKVERCYLGIKYK